MPQFQEQKRLLARILLQKSYMEGDFTLSSGRKSDYYFDCRQTSLHPRGAFLIGQLFASMLEKTPNFKEIKAVAGMTMGADPLITATSLAAFGRGLELAGLIVRKQAKAHGAGRSVEGLANVTEGDRVLMLEDVVSTGGSVVKACKSIEEAGMVVDRIFCILERGEGGRQCLKDAGYEVESIFTRNELVSLGK